MVKELKQQRRPNVVLIIMDAVRADRLSLYGYGKETTPNLGKLSRESTVFKNAISSAPWTLPATASILTGLYPSEHGATHENLKIKKEIITIQEILSDMSYNTIGISSNAWISISTGLGKGFHILNNLDIRPSRKKPIVPLTFPKFLDKVKLFKHLMWLYEHFLTKEANLEEEYEKITLAVVHYVSNLLEKDSLEPFFIFIHLMNAHLPYSSPDRFRKVFFSESEIKASHKINEIILEKSNRFRAGVEKITEEELDILNKAYDSAILFQDYAIGKLVNLLEKNNLLENTVLIITADHGENIGDHALLGHQLCLYDTLVKVPLIIRYPSVFPENTIIESQVETKDIFYTILDIVENSVNKNLSRSDKTKSLIKVARSRHINRLAFGEYARPLEVLDNIKLYTNKIRNRYKSRSKFIRKDNYKYIWYENAPDELYDLNLDPKEENNIIGENQEKAREMKRLLIKRMKEIGTPIKLESYDKLTEHIDEKIQERLRKLGYL